MKIKNAKSRGPLLDSLDRIEALCEDKNPTLGEVLEAFGHDGHWVLMAFLIIPFLQPVPMVGLSTPFGIGIGIIGFLYFKNQPPSLPSRWLKKKLPAKTIDGIAQGAERLFELLNKWLHPRHPKLFTGIFRILNLGCLLTSALLLALPLPIPFSNALPGWVIFFQVLAHLERDGLFVVFSYIQFLICSTFFVFIGFGLKIGIGQFF